jgi:hypothetical protein
MFAKNIAGPESAASWADYLEDVGGMCESMRRMVLRGLRDAWRLFRISP